MKSKTSNWSLFYIYCMNKISIPAQNLKLALKKLLSQLKCEKFISSIMNSFPPGIINKVKGFVKMVILLYIILEFVFYIRRKACSIRSNMFIDKAIVISLDNLVMFFILFSLKDYNIWECIFFLGNFGFIYITGVYCTMYAFSDTTASLCHSFFVLNHFIATIINIYIYFIGIEKSQDYLVKCLVNPGITLYDRLFDALVHQSYIHLLVVPVTIFLLILKEHYYKSNSNTPKLYQ